MATKRSYSEDDKATALTLLTANRGNITLTSQETGVPATTLRKWRDGKLVNAAIVQKGEKKAESLAALFEKVSRLYLDRAMEAQAIADTRGKDAVIAAATAADKVQLLTGKATTRTEASIDLIGIDDDQKRRIIELAHRQLGSGDGGVG